MRTAAHMQMGKLRLREYRLPSWSHTGKAAKALHFPKPRFSPLQRAVSLDHLGWGLGSYSPNFGLETFCVFSPHPATR